MLILILIKKIISMFLVIAMGAAAVKLKLLSDTDSRPLSAVLLYISTPALLLTSFEVDVTPEVVSGLVLAFLAAILTHIVYMLLLIPLEKAMKLEAVEKMTVIYGNAGNLIIPLVQAMYGEEYVIYTCAFIAVQQFCLWSHGRVLLEGKKKIDFRQVFLNLNVICIILGMVIFVTGFRFLTPIDDGLKMVGNLFTPVSMLVTGMLIGSKDLKALVNYKRVWLMTGMRLVAMPAVIFFIYKFTPLASLASNGETILTISLMAAASAAAGSITQMATIYGGDTQYSSAVNIISTLCCIVTIPAYVWLFSL